MKKQYININGVSFEKVEGHTKEGQRVANADYRYHTIYDAYDKPSQAKIAIWEWWEQWANEANCTVWIASRNGFKFSIGFTGNYEGHNISGIITASYNKVVIL